MALLSAAAVAAALSVAAASTTAAAALAAAAVVGCLAAPFAAGWASCSLQGLPLADPLQLLLKIQGRTIVCSTVLPSRGLKLATLALANQQLLC